MYQDSIKYDSLEDRPLPKCLTDHRDGLNKYQPEVLEMKEDKSLGISIVVTGSVILLVVIFLTVYVLKKNRKTG